MIKIIILFTNFGIISYPKLRSIVYHTPWWGLPPTVEAL